MTTLAEAIEAKLNEPYWRLSVETSLAAEAGVKIIRETLALHGDDGDDWCDHCGFLYPCHTVRIIAEKLEVEV